MLFFFLIYVLGDNELRLLFIEVYNEGEKRGEKEMGKGWGGVGGRKEKEIIN